MASSKQNGEPQEGVGAEAVSTSDKAVTNVVPQAEEVDSSVARVEGAVASALDPVLAKRKEQIQEATERLHPVLKEALAHPLGVSALSSLEVSAKEFTNQEELLRCIDSLNEEVEGFMQFVKNPPYIVKRAAESVMGLATVHAYWFRDGGMLKRILIAFRVLAQTKLRELAKKPSSDPFDPEEFAREQMFHGFIRDFLAGIRTTGG